MAEFVHKKLENLRPVLEKMSKLELFTKTEIASIIKKLMQYEYKLQRKTKSKEDYLKYIQYGMDLLKLVKQRREKYKVTKKKSDIDFTIANKINYIFKEALKKYSDDMKFWISYLTFCKHVGFKDCINRTVYEMARVHQDRPKCWHIAAQWEIEETKNLSNAKLFLIKGLRFHPKSKLLYTDLIKLELDRAYKKKGTIVMKKEPTDESTEKEPNLTKMTVMYEEAFKNIEDLSFYIGLMEMLDQYENTSPLVLRIYDDLKTHFANEPLLIDYEARRSLKIDDEINDEMTLGLNVIQKCHDIYTKAIETVKDEKAEELWDFFIKFMFEIQNFQKDSHRKHKRKFLKDALLLGDNEKKLKEEHYLQWINWLNTDEVNVVDKRSTVKNELNNVLCRATEAIPQSETLWLARYNFLLCINETNLAHKIFENAIAALGEKSLELWELRLEHIRTHNPEDLGKFFQEALNQGSTICNAMKPIYLEWVLSDKGISAARQVYHQLCLQPPLCLELHKKMIDLEFLQIHVSVEDVRKAYEMAILQFGENTVKLWIDFIAFEMKHGNVTKVSNIYNKAIETLKSDLSQQFLAKFTLFKANHK